MPVPDPSSREPLAEVLARLFAGPPEDRIAVADIVAKLHGRSWPLLIAVFVFPNCVPTGIPWLSTITGIPIVLLVLQMILRRQTPALPGFIARGTVPLDRLQRLARRSRRTLDWLERVVKPRHAGATSGLAGGCVKAALLANAVILALPIPFDNLFPAWALLLFALALLERDGLMALAGWVLTVVTLAWTALLLTVYRDAPGLVWSWVKAGWQALAGGA